MKIGLLVLSINEGGQKGFYNTQETGLAKALDRLGHEIIVYKLIQRRQAFQSEKPGGTQHTVIYYVPTRRLGNNGLPDIALFDCTLDALICFSDMQIGLPMVYRWTQKHGILFFPYIGVVESHSTSALRRRVMNMLFQRNLRVYRRCHCLMKTSYVRDLLEQRGVNDTTVAPVGLDIDLLRQDYAEADIATLKREYGYQSADRILLYIGRLTEEKQPGRMVEIFSEIYKKNQDYKLLMVGRGELKADVLQRVSEKGLETAVKMIERIPNNEIWKLYRMADCFVNLNQREIFGMALLEAMYYECKVVAWKAPGPELIIENGVSGYLAESNKAVIAGIMAENTIGEQAHQRIVGEFTWDNTAKRIERLIIT